MYYFSVPCKSFYTSKPIVSFQVLIIMWISWKCVVAVCTCRPVTDSHRAGENPWTHWAGDRRPAPPSPPRRPTHAQSAFDHHQDTNPASCLFLCHRAGAAMVWHHSSRGLTNSGARHRAGHRQVELGASVRPDTENWVSGEPWKPEQWGGNSRMW